MAQVDSNQPDQIRIVKYRRVRGLWRTATLSRAALLTADDHLLLCDYRTGFTERYKRYYFRDIEAFIIRKTRHWLGAMLIWGSIAFLFFLIAVARGWNTFLEVVEGICLLFILRQALRGPSCRTHIQTAVQTDALPMLKRVRKTNRVLRLLFPLVEQAQGKREEIAPAARMSILPSPPASAPAAVSPAVTSTPVTDGPIPVRHELSWFHVGTFVFVLLGGLNAIWEVNYPSTVSFAILLVLFFLSVLGGVVALVRQARRRVHRGAAAMIWVLVISLVLGGSGVAYAYTMVNMVAAVERHREPVAFDAPSPFQMRHLAGFDRVLWSFGIWMVLLALFGLIFTFMPAPPKAQPPPLPGEPRAS